jgi:hypothetical protein
MTISVVIVSFGRWYAGTIFLLLPLALIRRVAFRVPIGRDPW